MAKRENFVHVNDDFVLHIRSAVKQDRTNSPRFIIGSTQRCGRRDQKTVQIFVDHFQFGLDQRESTTTKQIGDKLVCLSQF